MTHEEHVERFKSTARARTMKKDMVGYLISQLHCVEPCPKTVSCDECKKVFKKAAIREMLIETVVFGDALKIKEGE